MKNKINSQEKVTPKYVFLHLFLIVMLYAGTASFLTIIFQYVNILVPDLLSYINYQAYSYDLIRFSIASLLIVFPAFILSSLYLNKSYVRNPAIKEMKIRKWLIYFTLFIAALIIVVDLVRIVLFFLEGETALRFILKALSVLIVASAIFIYYLNDLKKEKPLFLRNFAIIVIIVVIIAVISGFFFIGSPNKERLYRFDEQRISDLTNIQSQVIYYWQRKEKLPQSLDDLRDQISGYEAPTDPQTSQSYEYYVKSEDTFELCADFNLESRDRYSESTPVPMGKSPEAQNWYHLSERFCFERKIDKDLYPPLNALKD
ncbi:MAG: DUF5671 domain-containing protein [Candidatus Pacebacteria bacterium]|nr:DUF5671 domain-containing protein [Candidatus Paceibacterota bacterium]